MIALAEVIRRFEPEYRARYGHTLSPERAQALRASSIAAAVWPRNCLRPVPIAPNSG